LARYSLNRKSSYKDVDSVGAYLQLQALLDSKAAALTEERNQPFNAIYFDLVWNDRHQRWGGNLFEVNP
jgi:hypothetical protein